ncbi:hypothetical protein G9A89_010477 [Geosiphon pyriformis]|nr:hypothetical protein G9A89_010477 [Geosiphon pyriformis]
MRYGLTGGPATRIALLVEKLKDEEQGASHLRSEVEKQGFNRSYAVLKNAFKNTLIKPREDYVDVFFRHLEQCANVLRTELTQEFKDFGIDGESAQYDVGKEEVEEIKKWTPQQVNEFLKKKSEELFLIKEDLDIIKTNRIAGQDFLLLTEEKLMRYGLTGGPATRIALLVEKLKDEEQGNS